MGNVLFLIYGLWSFIISPILIIFFFFSIQNEMIKIRDSQRESGSRKENPVQKSWPRRLEGSLWFLRFRETKSMSLPILFLIFEFILKYYLSWGITFFSCGLLYRKFQHKTHIIENRDHLRGGKALRPSSLMFTIK